MVQMMKRHSKTAGLPPGSLVFLGEKRVENATLTLIDYDEKDVREVTLTDPAECRSYVKNDSVTWINVTGLHDTDLLGRLGELFDIHPLTMEDILNTGQRPKLDDSGDSLFLVVKMLRRGDEDGEIISEQVSMLLAKGYLLTFQEMEGDVFGLIRERIRTGNGRVRGMGCDYLAYALIDAIVDNYFVVLEDLGDKIEVLQGIVVARPEPDTVKSIHSLKREMIFMRKNLWPLREVVSTLEKSENKLIETRLRPYLRDIYEHTFQVIDTLEILRDMLSETLDTYMTCISNRMNEVMKVLTVIATIFIPLTFIAGVYGMNFEHMPELGCRGGYTAVLTLMLAVGIGMAVYFKRKKWW